MKNFRWSLLVPSFCVGFFSAQETRQIDTLNIKKNRIEHTPQVKVELTKKELEKSSGANLANVLKNISGVTLLQNGANVSKPVIQGLTNSRIIVLNNGVKVEGQHWGNDHAPEIDPFLAQNIEVVKGAEAVKYGANAMGGVVVMKSDNLPYFGRRIGGRFQGIGESNGHKWAGSLMLQGSIDKNNAFAWRVQSSAKKAGNYKTSDYYVENTGARELNYSAQIGYKLPKEKIEAFYSFFSTQLGVFMGSRVGNPEDLELRFDIGRPPEKGKFSYDIIAPRQEVKHHLGKILLESNRDFGKLRLMYAFQKNFRQEYDRRRGNFAHKPSMDVELTTHMGSLDYQKKYAEYFQTYFGVNYSRQQNYNVPGNGTNSVLPNFFSDNVGVYLSQEFRKKSWEVYAGLRYDYKTFSAAGYDRYGQYYAGQKKFNNISYSLGLSKSFGKYFSMTSNIGMAWRAPEAIELFSNGVHHGSAFYVKGNENLDIERGIKWSTNAKFTSERFSASLNVFLQRLNGFIYEMPTKEFRIAWSGVFPIFQYKQSDAFFRGIDFEMKTKLSSWLDYRAKASLIYASNLTESYYFPNISPENITHSLDFKLKRLVGLDNSYFNVEHHWANQQKRFSPEADLMPTSPKAYHLVNMSLGTDINIFNQNDMSISLLVSNVLNTRYKDYTDRFRYFVHGMGRNVQFRVNFNF